MGLSWVRVDTQWHQNPKVLMLVEDKKWQAIAVYVAGLCYSGAHGTDGFIPTSALPYLHGTKRNATELVAVGLWKIQSQGGWDINGWLEFQPSNAETQKRKRDARAAAEARWAKHAGQNGAKKLDATRISET